MMNLKNILYTLGISSAFLLASCSEKQEQKPAPLPEYSVANPIIKDIVRTLEYPGYLQSEQVVEVISRTQGFLEKNNFRDGAFVNKGDTLFVVETINYEQDLQTAKAQLANAQAKLEYSEIALTRKQEAAKSNAVSELEVLSAQTDVNLNKAAILSAQATIELAQTNLNYCYVVAPCSGRMSINLVDEGNYVGLRTQLNTIYKDDYLLANFTIEVPVLLNAQRQASTRITKNIKKTSALDVNILVTDASEVTKTYKGQLDYIAPSAELTTGTVDVRARVKNVNSELNNGIYIKVSIPYNNVKDAILIPESSIGTDQSGRYIYVVENDTVRYRSVVVGDLQKDNTREIAKGLSSDEFIITKAITKVRDGMAIKPKVVELQTNKD